MITLVSLLGLLLGGAIQEIPTLSMELRDHSLPAPAEAADLEQPITSYAVLDDARGFVVAYYVIEPDGHLHALKVRAYDKATRIWRFKAFPEPIGSVLSIKRSGGVLYVEGHSSPSAGPLLVLAEDTLDLKRDLDGWVCLMLDNGLLVFERSMMHFAPAHAAVLALYDPKTNKEVSLYPANGNDRGIERLADGDLVDRSFANIRRGRAAGTIEFDVATQQVRVTPQNSGDPIGPVERLSMTCNVGARPPLCRRQD